MKSKLYSLFVIVTALVSFSVYWAGWVWPDFREFIENCSGDGYSLNWYLTTCSNSKFGDYEHGAFSYELESRAIRNLKKSKILFMGNSRMQYALSNSKTVEFFNQPEVNASFYLFGFGYAEPYSYPLSLYEKFNLAPKMIVVAVDGRLFEPHLSDVARFMQQDPTSKANYAGKRWMQWGHWLLCNTAFSIREYFLCGSLKSVFRSRENGMWNTQFNFAPKSQPFVITPSIDEQKVNRFDANMKNFVQRLRISRDCIVFISVPYANWNHRNTEEFARRAGVKSVAIDSNGEWATIDGDHLTPDSSDRFSVQILERLKPLIKNCLSQEDTL